MSDNESKDDENAAISRGIQAGSVWLTSFFSSSFGTRKISRAGITIRFNIGSLVWLVLVAALVFGLTMLIKIFVGSWGPFYIITTMPGNAIIAIAAGLSAQSLSSWSPYAKSTGENFNQWVMERIRQKLSVGGVSGKKPSVSYRYSRARSMSGEPRIIKCREYIGTVPLTDLAVVDERRFKPGDDDSDRRIPLEYPLKARFVPFKRTWIDSDGLENN